MKPNLFVVVSGLPASGKTTLARELADALGLPLLDKDDILEALFESEGGVDVAARQRLSRMSDTVLARIAATSPGAVLVSFWRHRSDAGQSGAPISWIDALPGQVLELHCACDPDVAERRFRNRARNPAHNDAARYASLAAQLRGLAEKGPLGIGEPVIVRTDRPYDVNQVVGAIRQRIG